MIKFPKINATPLMAFLADAWLSLTRILQSRTEHMRVTNAEGTALLDGEVLYFGAGDRQAFRTTQITALTADAACISCEPTPAGGRGVARTQGLAFVLFDPTLNPAPTSGEPAYTSNVAGRASNKTLGAGFYKRIGTIEDASTFATLGGCYVNLNHCCTPTDNR